MSDLKNMFVDVLKTQKGRELMDSYKAATGATDEEAEKALFSDFLCLFMIEHMDYHPY